MIIESPLRYLHSWHYEMLANQERSAFYDSLLKDHCRDQVVFEIGTGSGLLAVLALKHGAKKVICCEENPMLALAAQHLFRRLGVEDQIHFLPKNSKAIETHEIPPVDLVLHELFGSDPFGEDFIPTLADARRFLKPGGIFLPEQIQIIYRPIPLSDLEEKLYYGEIKLIEMEQLLKHVHPGLRQRSHGPVDVFSLPPSPIASLLDAPFSYEARDPKLAGVDAVEVSFLIQHGGKSLQAASFESVGPRRHWSPMVFYKLDVPSDKLFFSVKNQNKLTVA